MRDIISINDGEILIPRDMLELYLDYIVKHLKEYYSTHGHELTGKHRRKIRLLRQQIKNLETYLEK